MTEPVSLGPWRGVDNVHGALNSAFQLGEAPAALVSCENYALSDSGWPLVREGLRSRVTTTAGLQLFPFDKESLNLYQDGGSIYSQNPVSLLTTELVSGLDPNTAVQFCAHADQVYYTNGTVKGRIVGGAKTNWGCSVGPTPSLAQIGGSLVAGRYHVALEPIDANGLRHAAALSGVITLSAVGAIRVSVSGIDSAATYLRVYVAGPDDDMLFLLGDVAVGALPYDITTLPVEDTVCKTIGLSAPPAHSFAFSYQNHLMLVAGSVVYPSLSAATHLYDLARHQVGRPETVLAGAGLPEGFWTVSAKGAYWASGNTPEQWRQADLKHPCAFSAGSMVVNSSALPFLRLEGRRPVALFMSSWGLAVGLSGGEMMFPFREQKTEDVDGKVVHFAFVRKGGIRQLVYMLSSFSLEGIAAPGGDGTAVGFSAFDGSSALSATGTITVTGTAGFGADAVLAAEGTVTESMAECGLEGDFIPTAFSLAAFTGTQAIGDWTAYSDPASTVGFTYLKVTESPVEILLLTYLLGSPSADPQEEWAYIYNDTGSAVSLAFAYDHYAGANTPNADERECGYIVTADAPSPPSLPDQTHISYVEIANDDAIGELEIDIPAGSYLYFYLSAGPSEIDLQLTLKLSCPA